MRGILIALALAASFVPFIPVTHAQGSDPQAVALTAADVPGGLRVSRSGTTTRGGGPAYEVFFEVSDPFSVSDDAIVQVVNVVAQPNDPVSGMNDFISATRGVFGSMVDQGPAPIGDEGRTFTSSFSAGPFTGSRAVTVFRRGPLVVGVTVSSTGSTPRLAEATQLAQLVDARLGPPASQ